MKRALFAVLAAFLSVGIASCGVPAKTGPSSGLASASSSNMSSTPAASEAAASAEAASNVVTFADPVLEKMVRGAMGRPDGNITAEEAGAVTSLNLSNEWRRYVSDGSEIRDIGGLEFFVNLEYLDLSFHAITDITPLSGLGKLAVLSLCGNTVSDMAPLSGLTGLKVLMLAGCPVSSYTPLSDIYPNLIEKDFTIAYTLAELGFVMDSERKQAIYDGDSASVRINHAGWGIPPEEWMKDCVRTVFEQNGYKIDIGYYPDFDTYVVLAYKDGSLVINYLYNHGQDSFGFSTGDRVSTEEAIRGIFTGSDSEDMLLVPVQTFHDILAKSLSLSAETLFEMPFDENDDSLPSPYERLGFTFLDYKATCLYEEQSPHSLNISVHRTEWDENAPAENLVDWSMELNDSDVNGYQLLILYYAAEGKYHVSVVKDGAEAAFEFWPQSGEYGAESPDPDTAERVFGDAFGTDGGKWYEKPVAYFEQTVQDRFGMSIGELYALPLMG